MRTNSITDLSLIGNENLEIIEGTGEILSDKKPNGEERPWVLHKQDSLKLYHLYTLAKRIDPKCISKSSYAALEHCASFLLYRIGEKGEKRLKTADFCKARLCSMCNWRKSLKTFGQTSKITDYMLEEYPSTRFIFVTFTVKNCIGEDLESVIQMMNDAFSKLTAKSRKYSFAVKFKKSLLGYMRAIEVTYNKKTDTYHPHIHAIFAVKTSYFKGENYIKQADWQLIWQSAMEIDYIPVVNVQTIKPKKDSQPIDGLDLDDVEIKKKAMVGAVAETAKYPVKIHGVVNLPEPTAIKVIIVLSNALRGKRLTEYGGLFKEIHKLLNLDDTEDGDLVLADEAEDPINEVGLMLFKYHARVGCYVC